MFQVSSRLGEKTEFGPGKTALYYNNNGLFSDPFLEDRLPNLEKYYNNPSTRFLNDYWNIDESNPTKYNEAFQRVMDLWIELDKDIPKFCKKERQLQNTWIDKIFGFLGWTYELEETSSKHGVTNFPDYALFASKEDWKKSKSLEGNNKFKKATAVADAKDWGISLDGKGFSNKNPSFQIINYLKQTDKNWGILTDGKYWRIYSLRSDSKHTTFYEIDLEKILATGDQQRFKYFYNFFRVEAFVSDSKLADRAFLDFVFDDGKFYSQNVEKNLQERVYKVVNSICQGFLVNFKNPSDEDLKSVYENSMYYVFKLMFILNCESKGLLEVNKQDDYYESSLRKKCIEIKEQKEQGKNWSTQPRTYNFIVDLFNLLNTGDERIGVHGFGAEPFEIGSSNFYLKNKISDDYLNAALLELACDLDNDGNIQFIDYKILSPDHIGSLFEGLLEFNLIKDGKRIDLVNNKGDRKATGSYYTPDYLVDYIVEETLKDEVSNKNPFEILKLRILDPAMGSGHFLLGVVKYLENTIVRIQHTDSKIKGAVEFDKIRKEVLKNCVFGVDINPLATQLAKFSLWIYTSNKGDYLEPLKDQLKTNNTLSDKLNWSREFDGQLNFGKIDAIVGNPPYVGHKGGAKKIFNELKSMDIGKRFNNERMDLFYYFFHLSLDLLKDGGNCCFISTNYYLTADSAVKLRVDLANRADLKTIINFNEMKIFKSAQGQHNIITLFKKCDVGEKSMTSICNVKRKGALNRSVFEKVVSGQDKQTEIFSKKKSELFDGARKYMRLNNTTGASGKVTESIFEKMTSNASLLGSITSISQGVVSGLDRVGDKHLLKFSSFEKGHGVFVVNKGELKNLNLNAKEKEYIRPWFKNSDISHFHADNDEQLYLLHMNSDIKLDVLPNIKKHLSYFKKLIESRNYDSGELSKAKKAGAWWALSSSRREFDFSKEKIVAPQRSIVNKFGYTNKEWCASADVYFITASKTLSIKCLVGILNSKTYYNWLYFKGKKKGEALELYLTPLSEIPVPHLTDKTAKEIESVVEKVLKRSINETEGINLVDAILYKFFGFTEVEIMQIEKRYPTTLITNGDAA